MKETWKDIKGYEGLYQVSNLGRIKSLPKDRWIGDTSIELILSPGKSKSSNYYRVNLSKNGTHKQYLIHRLVAQAFIPNPENLPEVNHKDENKLNNHVDNLEWCHHYYNSTYGTTKERNRLNTVNKKAVRCIETGIIYVSMREAGKSVNRAATSIGGACNGKQKTCRWLSLGIYKIIII